METTVYPDTPFPTGNPNASHDTLSKAVAGAHGAVDRAAVVADEAVRKASPVIGRVAERAHHAVDKAASVAVPTVEWLSEQSDGLKATEQKIVADARQYVSANPLKSVAVALAAGLLIGRILR